MDPMDHIDRAHAPRARADDDDMAALTRQLDDVMSGTRRDDVDLRAYLLDPPPTAEELERSERRRRLVRNGSLVATGLVALLLLMPWPGADPQPAPAPPVAAASAPAAPTEPPAQPLPERVDVPPAGQHAGRRRGTPRRHAARAHRARGATSAPRARDVNRSHEVAAAPAPPARAPVAAPVAASPPPAAAAPAPAPRPRPEPQPPAANDAVLVPVM